MKKWICCILCGMLVLSSFLATGTATNKQQKIQTPVNTSEEYIPVMFEVGLTVSYDGTPEIELNDQHLEINNWTGANHTVKIVVNINNSFNNTGSIALRWRIAQFPSSGLIGWILFWVMHGKVKPTDNQADFLGMSTLHIEWMAADPDVTLKDYSISIEIDSTSSFEIDMWLLHPPQNKDWSSIAYTPMTG